MYPFIFSVIGIIALWSFVIWRLRKNVDKRIAEASTEIQNTETGTILMQLRDPFESDKSVYYVSQVTNPTLLFTSMNNLMTVVGVSNLFTTYEAAFRFAADLETKRPTTIGVLKPNKYTDKTLGELCKLLE